MDETTRQLRELGKQRQWIVEEFYRIFDFSWVMGLLADPRQLEAKLLGEGRHFRSHRLATGESLDLVLSVAKPQFYRQNLRERGLWCQRIRQLQRLTHPLLAPLETLRDGEETLAIVMPYCEAEVPPSELRRDPYRQWLENWEHDLAGLGLFLDDYWQLRLCRGHPLVIDYSDLRDLPRRVGR